MTVTFQTSLPDEDQPRLLQRSGDSLAIDRETTPTNNGIVRIQAKGSSEPTWRETVVDHDTLSATIPNLPTDADIDVRARTETDHVTGTWTDPIEYQSRTSTLTGNGTVTATRQLDKTRTTSVHGSAATASMQTLQPVFPDERALDVSWDFSVEHMGFVTEWLDETSIIPEPIRDGIGVTVGGHLSTTITVQVEYDKTGDGTIDAASSKQSLSQAYNTLAFDDNELFGEDGWYRVVVRGLRAGDTINHLDIGAVHANL